MKNLVNFSKIIYYKFCFLCVYLYVRFLELMRDKNMPIWAISTGNEPLNAVIGWFFVHFMSLGWTAETQVYNIVYF